MIVLEKMLDELFDLLLDNGVHVECSEYENPDKTGIAVTIKGIDFTEHDKPFLKEIEKLKAENAEMHNELQEIKELRKNYESVTQELPSEPIAVAQMLINATGKYGHGAFAKMLTGNEQGIYNIYDISELRQIAEHLLVYCNNNEDKGEMYHD